MRTNKEPGTEPGRNFKCDTIYNPDSIIIPHRFGYKLRKTPWGFALTKTVDRQRHFYRKLQGWAIAVDVLKWAFGQGIECIVLTVKGEGKQVISVEQVKHFLSGSRSYLIEHEGFETQLVIPERYWAKVVESQLSLF